MPSFLAGYQTVNAYSKNDLTNKEYHWALMFVGQRLKFLLEKEVFLYLLCHFIDVVVVGEGCIDVQTYVLGGVDVVQYLS
jgi:hypothetical protein